MNVLARKHYYKQRRAAKREAKQAQELGALLKSAARKIPQVKGKKPLDADNLSLPQQVALLEGYASRLQSELDDFIATWGEDGKDGAGWLRSEIQNALRHVARLKIQLNRGER
jgi:hypothetical protein